MAHLLLIDDDAVFLQSLARSLQRKGETVLTASTAQQAMDLLTTEEVDRVVLDLNLAGESGIQLLPQLLHQQPELRVIMLTAYASVVTAVEAIKRGALNYLCKPVTAADVLAAFNEEEAIPASSEADALEAVSLDRLEWEHIQRLLVEHQGNISATAHALNMHRRTLQRKLQKRPVQR
jgi:two-component system response regulator RegA